jgi:hypothetical protein
MSKKNKAPHEAEGDSGKKLMVNKEERRKKNGGSEKSLLRLWLGFVKFLKKIIVFKDGSGFDVFGFNASNT